MAYIRWGQELPSGNKSKYFVIGGPDGLVNMDRGSLVPYNMLNSLFKEKTDSEVQGVLEQMLDLHGEELDVVCDRLFQEQKSK